MARGDLDRLLEAAAVDQVKAADRFLRLREGTVGNDRLAIAHADRAATARRSELVADLPDAASGEVVHPRKRLVLRRRGGARPRAPLGLPCVGGPPSPATRVSGWPPR